MKTLEQLIVEAEKIAKELADGHLTILKFTTGWKISLGTPDLDNGENRDSVWNLQGFCTLEEALLYFIEKKHDIF